MFYETMRLIGILILGLFIELWRLVLSLWYKAMRHLDFLKPIAVKIKGASTVMGAWVLVSLILIWFLVSQTARNLLAKFRPPASPNR